ncbi:MAG: hypothetical protein AAFV25_12575 [Bacteroidota bacterium]
MFRIRRWTIGTWALVLLCSLLASEGLAQLRLPSDFQQLLEDHQLDFYAPVEGTFKNKRLRKTSWQACDFAMYSKKARLEVRYLLQPFHQENPKNDIPHVKMIRMASHLASNEDDSHIAIHKISKERLSSMYRADWGATAVFEPKRSFSDRRYCQMLSLFREDELQLYVFILFDRADEEVEQQLASLRFREGD